MRARQGKFVRFALLLTLLGSALAAPPVSAEDPPILPSYLEADQGTLSPIEVDSPEDEEAEEGDDEELKPPDWCEVTPSLIPSPTVNTAGLPDPGGFSTASMSSSEEEVDPRGTATEQAAVTPQGAGIPETGFCPPDPTVAAGPNHLMLAVNASIASYSKTPAKQWTSTFKSWLGPHVKSVFAPPDVDAPELFFYHPTLIYDQLAERFIFSLAAVEAVAYNDEQTGRSGATSLLLFGLSKTSNPNSGWCVYGIPSSGYSHDPRIGYDDDFLFLTNNEYGVGDSGRVQAGVYMIPKAPIMTSTCAEASFRARLGLLNPDNTLAMFLSPPLPADPQTTPLGETEPYYLVSAKSPAGLVGGAQASDELVVWRVTDGLAVDRVAVALKKPDGTQDHYFRPSPTGGVEETCIPGGRRWLDAYDSRLRNAVSSDGRVWASQVVSRDQGFAGRNLARLRVYGIDPEEAFSPGGITDVVVRRDLAPPPPRSGYQDPVGSYFNPAVMATTDGDMAIGFNGNVTYDQDGELYPSRNHPSFWTARWVSGEWQPGVQVKASPDCYEHEQMDGLVWGSGATGRQVDHPYRWGETTGASPDPDGSGIWFYGVHATADRDWATWLAKVTL